MTPPPVVAFDVVETLVSLDGLRPRLEEAGAGEGALELWFARLLRDGFAITAAGGYRPFSEVAAASLTGLLADPRADAVEAVLGGFKDLDAHPDAEPAMRRLHEAGVRVLTLTNGSAETTETLLERNGLARFVERSISVDEVKAWKPAAEPYLHAARTADVEPHEAALVAVHAWDVHGAKQAGLRGLWANRLEGRFPASLGAPDASGLGLVEVVEGLLP